MAPGRRWSAKDLTASSGGDAQHDDIRQALVTAIGNASYAPGDRLPSVRSLAERWSVSLNTVAHAYRELEQLGLARSEPRRGYFVVDRLPPDFGAHDHDQAPGPRISPRGDDSSPLPGIMAAETGTIGDRCPWADGVLHPDLQPHKLIAAALRAIARSTVSGDFSMPHPAGLWELRQQISRQLHVAGLPVTADELLICNGLTGGLEIILEVFLKPGDHLLVQSPVPPILRHLAGKRLLSIEEIPASAAGISLEVLDYLLVSRPARLLLLWPRAMTSTGWGLGQDQQRQALELAARAGVQVVCDHSADPLALASGPGMAPPAHSDGADVIRCGSLASEFGPSLPLAWIATDRHQRRLMEARLLRGDHAQSLLESLASTCLADDSWLGFQRQMRRQLAGLHARFEHEILPLLPAGSRCERPVAGFVRWVELPEGGLDAIATAAAESDLRLATGDLFSDLPRFRDGLRFNVGGLDDTWPERLRPVLAAAGA